MNYELSYKDNKNALEKLSLTFGVMKIKTLTLLELVFQTVGTINTIRDRVRETIMDNSKYTILFGNVKTKLKQEWSSMESNSYEN